MNYEKLTKKQLIIELQKAKDEQALTQNILDGLRSKVESYEALCNTFEGSAVILDTKGTMILCNKNFGKILGIEQKDLVGKNIFDLVDKKIGIENKDKVQKLIDSKKPVSFEFNYGDRVVNTLLVPILDDKGNVHRFGILGQEITEAKKTFEKLSKSEKRFRSIFDNSMIGLYRTTPDGKILMANKAILSMLGYDSVEQLKERNLEKSGYEPGYPRTDFKTAIEKSNSIIGLESAWKNRTGNPVFVRESAYAVRDENGRIKYYEGTVEDISEKKKVEESLKRSENNYRTLTQNIPNAAIYLFGNDRRISLAEGSELDDLGLNKNRLKRKKIDDILVAQTQNDLSKSITTALNGRKVSTEFMIQNHTYLLQVAPIKDENGNVIGGIAFTQNVSERTKAVQELERIFKLSVDLICKVSMDGVFLRVNPAFTYLLGYTEEELLEMRVAEIIHKNDLEKIRGKVFERLSNGKPTGDFECRLLCKGGKYKWFSWAGFPESNKVVYGIGRDISERKRMQKQFDESVETLRSVISQSMDGIVLINSIGEIIEWNKGEEEISGYKKEEVIGKKLWDIQYANALDEQKVPGAYEQVKKRIMDMISGDLDISPYRFFERKIKKPNGSVLTIQSSIFPIETAGGKLIGSISRDITDMKAAGDKLRMLNKRLEEHVIERTKELQKANSKLAQTLEREKDLGNLQKRFISMISHEYRTPLTVLSSSLSLLDRYIGRKQLDKTPKHLKKMSLSVNTLTNLVEDVVSFSRSQEGRLEVQPEPLNIIKHSANILDEMKLIDGGQHRFEFVFFEDNINILADAQLFRQILKHLISNALKFSPKNTLITLKLDECQEGLCLNVIDRGIGMNDKDLKNLFRSFYRREEDIGVIKGAGLGLSIVKCYVDNMNWMIHVESTINKGSTFSIIIPEKK